MQLSTYFWPFYAYRLTPLRPSKKPSLLLSLYFHVVLQHLKTYIQTNFRFKVVLRYMTFEFPGFCEAAFNWRPGKILCGRFWYLNIPCLRINITFSFWVPPAKNSLDYEQSLFFSWSVEQNARDTQMTLREVILRKGGKSKVFNFSKLQLVVYYQCCVLIGWPTTGLYVMAY